MALLFGVVCGVIILVLYRYKSHLKTFLVSFQSPSTEIQDRPCFLHTSVDKTPKRSPQEINEPKTVILPDLFVSWAKIPLKMNPNYDGVAAEAEAWFNKVCNRNEKESRKWAKAKIPCFAGLWLPEIPAEEYRTVIDFLNWIWAWDDKIDEGVLDKQPDLIKIEIDQVLAILSDSPGENTTPDHPINHVLQSVWERMVLKASKGALIRFRTASMDPVAPYTICPLTPVTPETCIGFMYSRDMKEYMDQVLEQAHPGSLGMSTDMDSFIINHRGSSGAKIIVHISEYANGLDVPDFVFEDPAIQRIMGLQPEHFLLSNDIYSYARESRFEHHHNIIHILRTQGMTQQEAFDHVAEAIVARYKEWDDTVAQVPSWGEAVDAQVQKYIEATRLTIVAHLEWSFLTERYFGANREIARKTRRVAATPMY